MYIAVGLRWILSFLFNITTYNQFWLLLKHNTVLLTDTANKILNIKLSLWQTWYKVHSLYISRSVCMDPFHFYPRLTFGETFVRPHRGLTCMSTSQDHSQTIKNQIKKAVRHLLNFLYNWLLMITLVLSQSESFCLSYTLQKWFFKFKESLMIHTEGQKKKPYTSSVIYSKCFFCFFVQCCCFFVNWSRPFCLYI